MVISDPKARGSDLRILAFETAATMSRLVSLHHMVSDQSISKLRAGTMRSQSVAYLISTDQAFLFRLVCAELINELDRVAEAVSRLSHRCRGAIPVGFDRVYADLKAGLIDPDRLGLRFDSRGIDKRAKRMEKFITKTSKLYSEMEVLADLEAMETRKWGKFSGPIPIQKQTTTISLQYDIKWQDQRVGKLKEDSLWTQSFYKIVELMSGSCYSIFARICVVFSPFVSGLPRIVVNKENSRILFASSHLRFRLHPGSGPLIECRTASNDVPIRNSSCPIIAARGSEADLVNVNWSKMLRPAANTVGGLGLDLLYANIILLAERVMIEGKAEQADREEIYEMLPLTMRRAVSAKLRGCWRERGAADGSLAAGWKDAVWRIFGWLGPIAHDTIQWQLERNMDRRKQFELGPRKLLMQTLHFADKVKTEAAIVEVLVGLSLVCWYDEQSRSGSDKV